MEADLRFKKRTTHNPGWSWEGRVLRFDTCPVGWQVRLTVYNHRNKNKIVNLECFFFRLISVYCDSIKKKNFFCLFVYCYLFQELMQTLMARVENSSRSFEKTLNAWDWTLPEENLQLLFKRIILFWKNKKKKKKTTKNSDRGKCNWIFVVVFVSKGSYQSLSPKTLKEGW